MTNKKILITGANGQIGTVLVSKLKRIYGDNLVVPTDLHYPDSPHHNFHQLDVLDRSAIHAVVKKYQIEEIYHLAAILSAKGEANPFLTWEVNMNGLFNVLEVCKTEKVKLFFPSSIAVFGQQSPKHLTPQFSEKDPQTVYGISKVAGELWGQYYFSKYGVDVRSVRLPGVIGYQSKPGGGTTDYAVEMFQYAVKKKKYTCFLSPNQALPMIYMDDVLNAMIQIMEVPGAQLTVRTAYNLSGFSVTPSSLASSIQQYDASFQVVYEPDAREDIARMWPHDIDDQVAQNDWGWKAQFDLASTTKVMWQNLSAEALT